LYDGKTGEKVQEMPAAHKGSVYSLCWSPDSKMMLSVGADKQAIFWDMTTKQPVNTVNFGTSADQMQMACVWVNKTPISLSLDGTISYLSESEAQPVKVIKGHNKFITAMTVYKDNIITASFDARLFFWNQDGTNQSFTGSGHTNQISTVAVQGDKLYTGGMDNSIRVSDLTKKEYANSFSTENPVVSIDASVSGTFAIAATKAEVIKVNPSGIVSKVPAAYGALSAAVSLDEKLIAIGGSDKKVHLLSADLKETAAFECMGEVVCVKFSPDGKLLASADSSRNIFIWDIAAKKKIIEGWQFHNAKINSIAWTSDSKHLASGSLDGFLYVWSIDTPDKRISVMNAGIGGINAVAWLNDTTLVTAGQDCAFKTWTIKY